MIELKKTIKQNNLFIDELTEEVGEIVKNTNSEIAHATVMVSHELLENVIKYGIFNDDQNLNVFQLESDNNSIKISVTNVVQSEKDIDNIVKRISTINQSNNVLDLYQKRLLEIKNNRVQGESKLGFYKINYEGKFKLQSYHKNNIITIVAIRNLKE